MPLKQPKGWQAPWRGSSQDIGDERKPGVEPRAGGGWIGKPGVVGGVDHVLFPLEAGEGSTSSEAKEVVDAGNDASGVRPRIRRVGAVVLAAFQEGAVCARRDDGANAALREGRG